jgi:uncharacterized phiE125 gp8 family phage protein
MFLHRAVLKAYTYKVITAPTELAVPLSVVKEHLRIDPDETSEDSYLTLLVKAVTNYAQDYTKRTFLTTEFETYRDTFFSYDFSIRRSPLQSVEFIKYYKDGVLETLPTTDYYYTLENDFSKVFESTTGAAWPKNIDKRQQAIVIRFIAGYGDDYTSMPSDLVMGMLNHIAMLFESRGDCTESGGGCGGCLPMATKMIYNMYKVKDITAATYMGI